MADMMGMFKIFKFSVFSKPKVWRSNASMMVHYSSPVSPPTP
jgi:hypothetical protein